MRGSPTIFINDAPTSPLMFFGWAGTSSYIDQVQYARDADVHLFSFGITMPWPKPGQAPDFSQTDYAIELTLAADPSGLLLPRFDVGPPEWWLNQHPEDRMLFDDGTTEGWSMASEAWQAEMLRHLRTLVRHCEEKYGDHILGYHPCGQNTGEWFYFRSWEPRLGDFSATMSRGFAQWAKEKYGSVDALRRAWNDRLISFEQITVPSVQEQLQTDIGFFRDPQRERKVIDYFEYKQQAMEGPLENIARAIKDETREKKLVCFFYGYTFEMHGLPLGPQTSGHLALAKLIQCSDVDIVCSPISYFDRGLGGAGCFMSAVDSVRSGGKLWLSEDDTRTYLSSPEDDLGRVDTSQQTTWIHERNFAQLWPRRLACWYMDLGGTGWLAGKDIWDHIASLQRFYKQHLEEPASWSPEAMLIVDEASPFYTACTNTLHSPLVYQMRREFSRMGTSFRIHLLSDLVEGHLPPAKVYFFVNCFHLSGAERDAILGRTRGTTTVWFYGNGFLRDTADDTNISEAVSMTLARGAPQSGQVTPNVSGSPLTEGLNGTFGTDTLLDPLWTVQGDKVEVLGWYPNGEVAAAARWTPTGLHIYIGALQCPSKLLRNILHVSGVSLTSDSDDVVLTDGRFLGVVASSPGLKHLVFQNPHTIVRDINGQEIAFDADSFDMEMALGETQLFILLSLHHLIF